MNAAAFWNGLRGKKLKKLDESNSELATAVDGNTLLGLRRV